jgi:hypothetical protein
MCDRNASRTRGRSHSRRAVSVENWAGDFSDRSRELPACPLARGCWPLGQLLGFADEFPSLRNRRRSPRPWKSSKTGRRSNARRVSYWSYQLRELCLSAKDSAKKNGAQGTSCGNFGMYPTFRVAGLPLNSLSVTFCCVAASTPRGRCRGRAVPRG